MYYKTKRNKTKESETQWKKEPTNAFKKFKKKTEDLYKKIKEVYCPYFAEQVAFNTKGLNHIKMKAWNKSRSTQEQLVRLKLLKYAPQIIRKTHTLQEFKEVRKFERQKINSRWEQRVVTIRYYAFIAIIDEKRIKVVVKEIDGSKKIFWSIIPKWKTRKSAVEEIKKILCEGNLENQ